MKHILYITIVLTLLVSPLYATAGGRLKFSVKNCAARGQPLIMDISAGKGALSFRVEWQGVTVKVPASCGEDGCAATLILPTAYENSGSMPVFAAIDTVAPDYSYDEQDVTVGISGIVDVEDKIYTKQALTVDPQYVNISKKNLERANKEREAVSDALKTFSATRMWAMPLRRPLPGGISGEFGVQRIFNEEPRSRHSGIDFRGKVGSPVLAVADGTVILTGEHYFAGNSVYIDHGQGVVSAYFHLSKILLKKGEQVKAGDSVGLVGATGRVTGPHLHFGLAAQGIFIDPLMLF